MKTCALKQAIPYAVCFITASLGKARLGRGTVRPSAMHVPRQPFQSEPATCDLERAGFAATHGQMSAEASAQKSNPKGSFR
jgi:hypothetical protein